MILISSQSRYPQDVAEYRSRIADPLIQRALHTFGAVILQGPRAVGKTTSGLHFSTSSVRLDADPELLNLASASPQTMLNGDTPRLIDEWQLAPSLWNAVRHEVDNRQEPGQFILTGSAIPTDDVTRHSGAGRFRRITMRPMTLSESGEGTQAVPFETLFAGEKPSAMGGPEAADYAELIIRGGWPALISRPVDVAYDYLSSYLEDIALIDLPQMEVRADPQRMQALIRAIARNTATETGVAKLAREADIQSAKEDEAGKTTGITEKTARRYLDALSRVFVMEEQPAWSPHLRSKVRLRTHAKWHFIDPSLAAAALNASPRKLLNDPKTLGLLFESLAIRDLRVFADQIHGSVYHYRDETGLEVDAIVERRNGTWAAFEVKLGGERHLETAAKNLQQLAGKVSEQRRRELASLNVITAGQASYQRTDGVNVIALSHLML